jgi:hypothetical protein
MTLNSIHPLLLYSWQKNAPTLPIGVFFAFQLDIDLYIEQGLGHLNSWTKMGLIAVEKLFQYYQKKQPKYMLT